VILGNLALQAEVCRMYRAVASMILIAAAVIGLAACESGNATPDGPGSVTAYVHGQTVVTFGGATR
jgi:hypothetical protein